MYTENDPGLFKNLVPEKVVVQKEMKSRVDTIFRKRSEVWNGSVE